MRQVETTAGTIEVQDTGGEGPVVVLLHGLLMDHTLYRDVVADLARDHRCVVPVLPLGSHRIPMRPDADLTMHGFARIVAEVLEALDLRDVVLVGNDHGLSQPVAARHPERIGRLVITSQEAFDNIPPGLPGKFVVLATKLPGGIRQAALAVRLRPLQRLPIAFGWMTNAPLPKDIARSWTDAPLKDARVRRDLLKYATSDYDGVLVEAAEELRAFDKPTLVAWSADDKVMPPEHGRRLARMIPGARHTEIANARTLVPLDQPAELARLIRELAAEAGSEEAGPGATPARTASAPPR